MKISLSALMFAIIGGAFAQLLLKAGLIEAEKGTAAMFVSIDNLSAEALLFISVGIILYGTSMVAWIIALREYELCYAYPLLSLGYLIVYAGAVLWPGMGGSFSGQKTLGILLIVVGVAISAQKTNPGLRFRHAFPKIL